MSSPNYDHLAHLKIPLEDIISATNNFDDENILGTGGFGNYYWGQISWSGELISISAERMNKELDDETEQQFWTEISMLSSLEHRNVVSFVGFCDENGEKIIINKYENWVSLDNILSNPILTWVRSLKLCLGVAHALSYIHYDESRYFSLIHQNIESSTVLLNANCEPKLSVFRLSMKIEASQRHDSFHVDEVCDREGYTDPTYIETKTVSHKSDIYSFGVVMFELLCGRKAVIDDDQDNKYLASLAVTHYREKRLNEIIQWDLLKQMDLQSFNIFAEIAYGCLNQEQTERPNIDEIVTRLEKALELQLEHHNVIMSSLIEDLAHLKIPLKNILSATNNFAEENITGSSGFCKEYKGQLLWSGDSIDICARRLNKERDDEDEGQFWLEISMLSSLKHKNLVSMIGFCDENDDKIIINRRETRGSLINYLTDARLLTWVQRLEICLGLAHALSYIQYDESRDFSVIHRNINIVTIVLNDNWEPKLGDFEHSMKIQASQRHNSFHTRRSHYVKGYGDPTYIETNSVSHKSDMYSFGIILFELLCGRYSIIDEDYNKYLAPVAIAHYREKKLSEVVDWELWDQMDSQSFNTFAEIAYDCLNEERSQRPNIDEIVPRLEKSLELQLEHQKGIMSTPKDDLSHLKIPLEDILSATNNFAEENIIFKYGFFTEYMGQLLWSGELICIHAGRWLSKEGDGGEQLWWREISMLSSLKHKNVISLVGFCDENGEKITVTKGETRGRLCEYLSDPMFMPWVRRLEICVGLAHALSYIHYDESHDFSVIHRNIHGAAVLLNNNLEPTLTYFQRSMKIETSERHHSFHTNTLHFEDGYGDPTYIETKSISHKSDMYSFGILLLELLCGRRVIKDDQDNKNLASAAISHYKEKKLHEIIDRDLWKQMDLHSFKMFAEIAYECLDEERSRRPNIDDIVPRLKKSLELARENTQIHSSPDHLAHLRIPLEDIESATNYFDKENLLGTTVSYTVYKGELCWLGELINISAYRVTNKEWNEIEDQFWNQISMLSSLKQKNIVSIVGFCNEVGAETIVYKRDSRGTLAYYLSDVILLTWVKRLEICVGLARALSYIHYDESRDFSVIHRDINSFAVRLNNEWEPKLSGFQHSMKIKASERHHAFHNESVWSRKGYTEPTYIETSSVSYKSDIYSFGIVLFELLCGRKSVSDDQDNKYLAPLAIFHYKEKILDGIIDPDLLKQMNPRSLDIFAETAYQCLNEEQSQRPNIDQIVTRLEKALELQLKCENMEHSLAVDEFEGTSFTHDEEGSTSRFTSRGVESNSSEKTMPSPKYISHSQFYLEDIRSATDDFSPRNFIKGNTYVTICQGRMLHSNRCEKKV